MVDVVLQSSYNCAAWWLLKCSDHWNIIMDSPHIHMDQRHISGKAFIKSIYIAILKHYKAQAHNKICSSPFSPESSLRLKRCLRKKSRIGSLEGAGNGGKSMGINPRTTLSKSP